MAEVICFEFHARIFCVSATEKPAEAKKKRLKTDVCKIHSRQSGYKVGKVRTKMANYVQICEVCFCFCLSL